MIGAHVIVGQAIQFAQLQNGQTYRSATGENLKISTGCVRRPFNEGGEGCHVNYMSADFECLCVTVQHGAAARDRFHPPLFARPSYLAPGC